MKNLSYVLKLVVITVVALFINACDKDDVKIKYDITGNWKVISYEDYQTSTVITKTEENTWSQDNNGDVTVNFVETDLTSGVISGRKVTNSFSGNYRIDNKGRMTISNFSQTRINEPEWGGLFDSIRDAESYEVRGNRLIIYCNQKKNSITLESLLSQ